MLQTGKIIKEFTSKSGKQITIRYPRWEDLDGMLKNINALARENTFIAVSEEKTKEEEMDFLCDTLKKMEKNDEVFLVVESEGKLVGSTGVTRETAHARSRHVGDIGIVVLKEFRGDGIGQELLLTILEQAKNVLNLTLVQLTVFGVNDVAKSLYSKLGFIHAGTIPGALLYKEQFIDHDMMYKKL